MKLEAGLREMEISRMDRGRETDTSTRSAKIIERMRETERYMYIERERKREGDIYIERGR